MRRSSRDVGLPTRSHRLSTAALAIAATTALVGVARADTFLGPSDPGAELDPTQWFHGDAAPDSHAIIITSDFHSGTHAFQLDSDTNFGPADFRSGDGSTNPGGEQKFSLGAAAAHAKPITFSFWYKLPDGAPAGEDVRMQLRYWNANNESEFVGEDNINLGSSSGDTAPMTAWKKFTLVDAVSQMQGGSGIPEHANFADIRFSVNNFTLFDGRALFDDFSVIIPSTSTWKVDADGNWSNTANWDPNVPNAIDAGASFGTIITAARTVTVDAPQTVGAISFSSPFSYAVAGTSTITMDVSTGSATLAASVGSHTISAPVVLNDDLGVSVDAGATLTVSGSLTATGHALTSGGAGTARFANVRASALSVNNGTVAILTNGSNSGASSVATLAIAGGTTPTATLDLNDNDVQVTAGDKATITSQIRAARNGGTWNGKGITSSSARTQTNHATTLGVLSGAEYHSVAGASATFDGFTVNSSDVLVKYTWYGDTDFNGKVNFDDYVRTDNGFNNHLSGWLNGDFDGNGAVNFDDYVLIDLAFNTQSGTLGRALSYLDGSDRSAAGMNDPALRRLRDDFTQFGDGYAGAFLSAVPEPASAALVLSLAAMGLVQRRRRRGHWRVRITND
jgi:hypothetical protein